MRKILSLFAIASMLVATSCSNEEFFDSAKNGTEANVSFTAQLPEGLQTKVTTRAYGDGQTATKLTVLVYDEDGIYLEALEKKATFTNRQTTVEMNLVKGKTYNIVFWAQAAEDAPFTLDKTNGTVTVSYGAANNENGDAFFANELDLQVGNEVINKTITLKRPFAQVNLGTSDMDVVKDAGGTVPTKSSFTVKGVFNTLDLKTGKASGNMDAEFILANIPEGKLKIKNGEEQYDYLAMNYILVSEENTTVDMSFVIEGYESASETYNVPVQRNWRTNLYGAILTTEAKLTVKIDQEFADEINNGEANFVVDGVMKIGRNEYNITEAVGLTNAAKELFVKGGTFYITDDLDMSELDYTAPTISGSTSIVIDGGGNTISGLKGQLIATSTGSTTVTVKDLTLSGSEFTTTNNGSNGVGGFIGYVGNTISTTLENCHLENATLEGGNWHGGLVGYVEGGVTSPIVIKDCSVKNCKLTGNDASVAAIIGHATGNKNSVVKIENVTVEGNTISSTKEEKAGSLIGTVGTGSVYVDNYTATNNTVNTKKVSGLNKFYGRQGNAAGRLYIDGNEVFVLAKLYGIDVNITVKLTEDAQLNVSDVSKKLGGENTETITIEGETGEETLNLVTTYISRLETTNANAKIILKNLKVTSSQEQGTWDSYDVVFMCPVEMENVVFEKAVALKNTGTLKNVTINETHDYYALWIQAHEQTVTMENCTINSYGRGVKISDEYVTSPAKVNLTVSGTTFKTSKKAAVLVGSTAGAKVSWKEGNDISAVVADRANAVWVDEDYSSYASSVTVEGCTKVTEGE